MKKLFPLALILVVVAVGWMAMNKDGTGSSATTKSATAARSTDGSKATEASSSLPTSNDALQLSPTEDDDEVDEYLEEEIKPATEIYSSAEEAMAALNKAAIDYDDLVLEQFAELDDSCSFCPELYAEVQKKIFAADTNEDEKSYFAEVLAISGRVENVEFLIGAIEKAPNPDMADVLTEALEITYGGDDVVDYLGEQLSTKDETLKESVVAALTNHGSRQAIDLLYAETVNSGDPDGYYSLGIGLGEIIPEEDAMPYLVDLANKQDEYSHLAVKALLNAGNEGLKQVMDIVEMIANAQAMAGEV